MEICNIVEKHDSSLMAKFRLGQIYYYLGDLDSSKAIFQQFDTAALDLKIASLFHLGMIYSQKGEREEALRIIDDIDLLSPQEFVIGDHLNSASIYMSLGIKESGYKYLESFFNKLLTKKMRFVYFKYLDIDRNFDNIKEEEEFIRITKK